MALGALIVSVIIVAIPLTANQVDVRLHKFRTMPGKCQWLIWRVTTRARSVWLDSGADGVGGDCFVNFKSEGEGGAAFFGGDLWGSTRAD